MKKLIFLLLIVLSLSIACNKEGLNPKDTYLQSVKSNQYFAEDKIPIEYQSIYGIWNLYRVSGGFSGGELEPNFDFLELKNNGIYGLIKNDTLFEYGKIEVDSIQDSSNYALKANFVSDYFLDYSYLHSSYYLHLVGTDTLLINENRGCGYVYYYKKAN